MAGTPLIISAALTTGNFLVPGADRLAMHPDAQAMVLVLLVTALTMAAFAAYRAANGPVRPMPPPGPALPGLRRRINGPRARRS